MATEDAVGLPDDVPASTNNLRAIKDGADMPAGVLAEVLALQGVEGLIAEVNARTDGKQALEVNDDCADMEALHVTLVASTDTPITFAQDVRIIRVLNWDTGQRVLVKTSAIGSDVDAAATRVGFAPTASVPGTRTLPMFRAASGPAIHLRSAGASECSVEGFF